MNIDITARLYDNSVTRWWADVTKSPQASQASAPWQIIWADWGRILARAVNGAMRDDYGIVAGSIAFAVFLSILPLLSLVALVYGMVVPLPDGHPAAAKLFQLALWGSLTLGPAAALLLIYRYGAARTPVPWLWVWPGALTGVLLWLGITLTFRLYVSSVARSASTYGSLAAVVVFLIWLMLSAWILLFGAKVNTEALLTAGHQLPTHQQGATP